MHRIDTATKAPDLFGAGKHGWKDGDKASGIVATDATAAFFNDFQENLAGVIEAAGIALVKGDYTQLLAALRSSGVFETAAQFEDSTKPATTAFAKRMGIQSSGAAVVTTSTAIGASSIGGLVYLNAAGAIAPALPLANSVPLGARLHFLNVNTGTATLTRSGADSIVNGRTAATNTLAVPQGDTAYLESDGASYWRLVGGSVALTYSSLLAASLATSGYQKLPSGLIFQWGDVASVPAGGSFTSTFPIAFPTAVFQSFGVVNGGPTTGIIGTSGSSSTSITLTNGGASDAAARWFSIGR